MTLVQDAKNIAEQLFYAEKKGCTNRYYNRTKSSYGYGRCLCYPRYAYRP